MQDYAGRIGDSRGFCRTTRDSGPDSPGRSQAPSRLEKRDGKVCES